MSIHILVLNFNGRDLLEECLPSVWEACKRSSVPCHLSVIDNASTDDSRAWLAQNLPGVGWIPCVENRILFSYNRVIATLSDHAVLLLNNDIKVEPDFINPLWARLAAEPSAFCVSPLHLDFSGNYNGGMNRCGLRLSLPWAGPDYVGAAKEAQKPGTTLFTGNGLFARVKFMELRGFDTLYAPMGWEDTDLCTRAWKRGWPSLYEPKSVIHHKSSASISKAYAREERAALGFRNAFLWYYANFSSLKLRLRFILLLPLTLLLFKLTGRKAQLRGFWMSLGRLEAALKRRSDDEAHDVTPEEWLLETFKGER